MKMCRSKVLSRRHTRRDTKCDAFIQALNLKNISKQIDTAYVKYKKDITNHKRQKCDTKDIEMKNDVSILNTNTKTVERKKIDNNGKQGMKIFHHPILSLSKYFIRIEPLLPTNKFTKDLCYENWFQSTLPLICIKKFLQQRLNINTRILLCWNKNQQQNRMEYNNQDSISIAEILCQFYAKDSINNQLWIAIIESQRTYIHNKNKNNIARPIPFVIYYLLS